MAPPNVWIAENVEGVTDCAKAWLASKALRNLVRELGGPNGGLFEPQALLRWSTATLDTRRGAERRDAVSVEWSDRWVCALRHAGDELGLMRTAPPSRHAYDTLLVLGGATTGNRLRVAMASELVRAGISVNHLVLVAGERLLGARELEEEPDSAADSTEWRNLARYADRHFGPLEELRRDEGGEGPSSWRDVEYRSSGPTLRLLVAPSARLDRRATTADAVRFFTARFPGVDRRSALIVTSAIYAPYQFFSVAPLLLAAHVRHAELVGTPTSSESDAARLAQRIGQEIHATISAASTLLVCGTG